ncbi:DUF3653 domain-containing protein [Thaumasiovibrio sp. DFM-14]|uniref:DUF3653 domain-containing protein n=1 Tax=Thaumasiovibrio sp. DFM-14 TaxID=3384792 RepID=UPI00399F1EC0
MAFYHYSFVKLFWETFDDVNQAAKWFHVRPVTVRRWLSGKIPVNPMAEKLLYIRSRGYLPDDTRWKGFKVNEERAIFITPTGRVFRPSELESFGIAMDFYLYYRNYMTENLPPREGLSTPYPFRGGRRMKQPKGLTITKEQKNKHKRAVREKAEAEKTAAAKRVSNG